MRWYTMKKEWNQEQEAWLKDNCEKGNKQEMMEYLGRTWPSIQWKARSLGLKRDLSLVYERAALQKSLCNNHSYFKKWSANMAYVLGMWFADGTVLKDSNYIALVLQNQDKYLVESIRKELCYEGKLRRDRNNWRLSIASKELHDDLISLGCVPNKSYIETVPVGIKEEHLRHFIRGNFDGDGGAVANKSEGRTYLQINLMGTKAFVDWLKENIPFRHSSISHRKGPCWQISYFHNEARKLVEWMYQDSPEIYLIRKRDKIKSIIEENAEQPRHQTQYNEEEDKYIETHYKKMTRKEIGEKLGRSWRSIERRAGELGIIKQKQLSEGEKRFIQENKEILSSYKISEAINRPASTIRDYIRRTRKDE